jgi:hypothetical protein
MKPFKVDTAQGSISVSGPSFIGPRHFFEVRQAKELAELLNAAWNDGWSAAFRERSPTDPSGTA